MNQAFIGTVLSNDPTIKIPARIKVLLFLRWIFIFLALGRLNLPLWLNLIAAVIYVFSDSVRSPLAGLMEILLPLAAFIKSIINNGLFSWFTIVFLLFILWYIFGGIMIRRWQKSFLNHIASSVPPTATPPVSNGCTTPPHPEDYADYLDQLAKSPPPDER